MEYFDLKNFIHRNWNESIIVKNLIFRIFIGCRKFYEGNLPINIGIILSRLN